MPTVHCCDFATGIDFTGLSAWASGTTYAADALVYYGNTPTRYVYKSLQNSNTNHAVTDGSWWVCVADGYLTADNGSTPSRPFKTIADAENSLTGGDTVKVGLSPAPTALSARCNWTNGSATVTAAADLTAEVAVMDFIGKATAGGPGAVETWWEVKTITYANPTTTITLQAVYSGTTTTSAVDSSKLGVTDIGEAATSSASLQSAITPGASLDSQITISGGWSMSTGLQSGSTWFLQSGTNRWGYGIYNGNYINVDKIGFLRCSYGIGGVNKLGITASNCTANGCVNGIGLVGSGIQIISCVTCANTSGINLASSHVSNVISCVANSNVTNGIQIVGGNGNSVVSCSCALNTGNGIYLENAFNNGIVSPVLSANGYGIRINGALGNSIVNPTFSGNVTANVSLYQSKILSPRATVGIQQYAGSLGDNRVLYEYGSAIRNTANARGGSGDCIEFTPTSATYWCGSYGPIDEWFICCPATVAETTLQVYMMKSAGFNGSVNLEAYVNGRLVTGPTTQTLTTDWAAYTITVASGDIPEAMPIVALRVNVRGTEGSVYVDDFSWS